MSDWRHLRVEQIDDLIGAIANLLTACGRLVEAWTERARAVKSLRSGYVRLETLEPALPLPLEIVEYNQLAHYIGDRRRDWDDLAYPARRYFDAEDRLTFSTRRWRSALESTRAFVAGASPWMDSPGVAPADNWCAGLHAELNKMGGLIHEFTVGDFPDKVDARRFGQLATALQARLSKLKQVPKIAAPSTGHHAHPTGSQPFLSDLLEAVKDFAQVAKVRQIRKAAGLDTAKRGRDARSHRYSSDDVNRMIMAVVEGSFEHKRGIVDAWSRWSTLGSYDAMLSRRSGGKRPPKPKRK